MAMFRGWVVVSQALSTVWRVGWQIPRPNRFLWSGSHLCCRDEPLVASADAKAGRVSSVCLKELELAGDYQTLNLLEETLKQSSGEAYVLWVYVWWTNGWVGSSWTLPTR